MCQWKFFVLRYRAKKSASKRVSAPAISLVAADLRSVGVSSGARRRAFTLIESIAWSPCRVIRLANVNGEGGSAAVIGFHTMSPRPKRCLRDVVVVGCYLRQSLSLHPGSARGAMIRGAWLPPTGRANRCRCLDGQTPPWIDAATPGRSFQGLPEWQVAHPGVSSGQA